MREKLNITFNNNICNKIEEYRKNTGASRTWISEQIGISRQSLSALEDSSNPTILMLIRVAIVLGCEVTDLFTFTID